MGEAQAKAVLKRYFGYESFRENQSEVVSAILAGRDALAIMPTGAGKSICYQVPALVLGGLTLVVSPLISLMKDQVNALNHQGIAAAFLNSSLSPYEQRCVLDEAAGGRYRLLYVAPERLDAPLFTAFCAEHPPRLVAVDEAHCISQWGQDFRPSYQRINAFVDALPQRPPVAAFTATATERVREDILARLELRDPLVVIGSFDRPNLRFEVKAPKNKNQALLGLLRKAGARGGAGDVSGIVYCSSRRAVEEVCAFLCDNDIAATRYHAGLPDGERRANQDDFLYDRKSVMVATNAFGMGIDKSNVSFVIHYNMPKDLESYYQEAGRAGRDGEPATCTLLYAPRDVRAAEFLMNKSIDEGEGLDARTRAALHERAEERLRQMTFYSTTSSCLRNFILRYFGEQRTEPCGNCGTCSTRFEERDATIDAQKVLSCVLRLAQRDRRVGRTTIVDILVGSKATKIVDSGYDTLSTYGIMAEEGKKYTMLVVDALVSQGYLAREASFSTVSVTEKGAELLRERRPFTVKVPKPERKERIREAVECRVERERKQSAARRATSAQRDSLSTESVSLTGGAGEAPDGSLDETESLFAELRSLRYDIAAEEGVPAYIVFTNHALHDMCRRMPETLDEFKEVSGVGEVKAERYGKEFLEAIAAWRKGSLAE